jgi:hypothetical protein
MQCRLVVICDTYKLYAIRGKRFTVFIIFQNIKMKKLWYSDVVALTTIIIFLWLRCLLRSTHTDSQLSVQDHGGIGHSLMVTAELTAVRVESCA